MNKTLLITNSVIVFAMVLQAAGPVAFAQNADGSVTNLNPANATSFCTGYLAYSEAGTATNTDERIIKVWVTVTVYKLNTTSGNYEVLYDPVASETTLLAAGNSSIPMWATGDGNYVVGSYVVKGIVWASYVGPGGFESGDPEEIATLSHGFVVQDCD